MEATQYKNGDKILVNNIATKDSPQCAREVTFENGGIRVKEHWFTWNYFFKVNFIVSETISFF